MNIGFSIVSISNNAGYGYFYNKSKQSFFAWDSSSIKCYLDKIIESSTLVYVTDSKKVYSSLSFLGIDYLSKVQLFDSKAFLNVYKNSLNIDLYELAIKYYKIDNKIENERIKKIWNIQVEKNNWQYIPNYLIDIYLSKDAAIAYRFGEHFFNIKLEEYQKKYLQFLQEFILYLCFLEQNGMTERKTMNRVVPNYHYDRVVTGRIVNTEPFCYQTSNNQKILDTYQSRFGDKGIILIADWSNIEFRVAAALAEEKLDNEKKDPYVLMGKIWLKKNEISDLERTFMKTFVQSALYGYEKLNSDILFKLYPKIKIFRDKILAEVKKTKKLTTIFGKTRYFSKDDNFETKALNTICQSTVASLCMKGIIEIQKEFRNQKLQSVPLPYVKYDSFSVDCLIEERKKVEEAIKMALITKTIPEPWKKFVEFEVKISA